MSRRGIQTSEFMLHVVSLVVLLAAAIVAGLSHLSAKEVAAGGVPLAGSVAWINAAYTKGRAIVKGAEANAQAALGRLGISPSIAEDIGAALEQHEPPTLKLIAGQLETVNKGLSDLAARPTTLTLTTTPPTTLTGAPVVPPLTVPPVPVQP